MSAATSAAVIASTASTTSSESDTLEERTLQECLEKSEMTVEEAMNASVETFCTNPPTDPSGGAFVVAIVLIIAVLLLIWVYV